MSSRNRFGTILQIGDILVSEDVLTEWFACDYQACKGACCIIGDSGAPLEEHEPGQLEEDYDSFSPLMSPRGKAKAEKEGFFSIDRDGDLVTPVVDGSEECAYTTFGEDGSCFCAIERCFLSGGCKFNKPISCRLYPIRVKKFSNGTIALNLHRWDICAAAFEKGKRDGTRVYEFLRGPLTDAFGKEFYDALCAGAEVVRQA